jgi:hypothetical protein
MSFRVGCEFLGEVIHGGAKVLEEIAPLVADELLPARTPSGGF